MPPLTLLQVCILDPVSSVYSGCLRDGDLILLKEAYPIKQPGGCLYMVEDSSCQYMVYQVM